MLSTSRFLRSPLRSSTACKTASSVLFSSSNVVHHSSLFKSSLQQLHKKNLIAISSGSSFLFNTKYNLTNFRFCSSSSSSSASKQEKPKDEPQETKAKEGEEATTKTEGEEKGEGEGEQKKLSPEEQDAEEEAKRKAHLSKLEDNAVNYFKDFVLVGLVANICMSLWVVIIDLGIEMFFLPFAFVAFGSENGALAAAAAIFPATVFAMWSFTNPLRSLGMYSSTKTCYNLLVPPMTGYASGKPKSKFMDRFVPLIMIMILSKIMSFLIFGGGSSSSSSSSSSSKSDDE